ncbi:MAG: hypothetical protein BWY66_02262 [bacterium ADurb.Bin374]|nr:MAG: hypothetical protein BWY66_02262 [bacterium ADurb.Bin374]
MPGIDLKDLQALYARGVNIIEHLERLGVDRHAAIEMSYDLQAGSYIDIIRTTHVEYSLKYTSEIASVIDGLGVDVASLLEAGVGEATTLANVVNRMKKRPSHVSGFDISWSRIKYAYKYYSSVAGGPANFFLGDLFRIPFADDSVDVVYTSHSIEPNGGREAEALTELYRVTRKYLVLLEPSYELATDEGKARIERLGFIRGLPEAAKKLGYHIKEYRAASVSARPSNPTAILVIEKNASAASGPAPGFVCPVGKGPLVKIPGGYWSESALLLYPELDGVACLTPRHGVVATHYADFHEDRSA